VDTKSRNDEFTALAAALKTMKETSGGATKQQYSFLQLASHATSKQEDDSDSKFEAVRYVEGLAEKQKSTALAQLASRMNSAVRLGSLSGRDPFAKVKGLVQAMLSKLKKEAANAATQKAMCDKETKETAEKKESSTTDVAKLTTKIEQKSAKSVKEKAEVAQLQKELADMSSANAELTKIRQSETALYKANKPPREEGLRGVKSALKVLRDYYAVGAKQASTGSGAASSIVGMLEVIESDFMKGLSDMKVAEQLAQKDYDTLMQANEVEKAAKDQDVKGKIRFYKGLDKILADLRGDLSGKKDELDAILAYEKSINEQCIKGDPTAARTARRLKVLDGLKEASQILDQQSLLQFSSKIALRGAAHHQPSESDNEEVI